MRAVRETALNLGLAVIGGMLMRWSFGLHPVWWLAWIAPAPLLAAALRSTRRAALGWSLLAGLIASSANFGLMRAVMSPSAALLTLVLQALLWVLVVGLARRVMLASASAWTVCAYPLLWSAADTLLAHLHPDGNWPSVAYSQAGFAPALQIVSLLGTAGLVFVLSLCPAALALAAVRGWGAARRPLAGALLMFVGCIGFGLARMPDATPGEGSLVGLAAIDDFIGPRLPPAQAGRIWSQYERHVALLGAQGARLVLLPEKIAVLAPGETTALRRRMGTLAAANRVWLALGIGVDDGRKTNHLWLFAPNGELAADYVKRHLAPGERDFVAGASFRLHTVEGTRYGLAICKDLHFAQTGIAYANLGAQAMLVPAWDFGEDRLFAARLSAVRGVESGMSMMRSAREGMLTISDAHGRVVAETRSAALPGATLLGRLPPSAPGRGTPYARTGDAFGWFSVAASLVLLAWSMRGTWARRKNGRAGRIPARPARP